MLAFDQNSDPFGDIPITQPPRAASRPPMLGQQQPLAGPPRQAPPQSPTNDAIDAERLRSLRLNNDAQQDTLDPGTVDMLAHQYILSGQLPPLGMGRSATASRQAILNRASSIAGVRSGESVQAGFARYRNGVAALHQQEGQLTAIRGNEAAALANGQQYIDRSAELPGQTRFSPINAISNFVQRRAGGTTITQMDTAHDNFANESARVISGAPSGAGVLSDSARQQWMDVLNSDASIDQKRMALEQLRADMDNRVNALDSNIQQGYRNLESGRPVSSGDGQQRGPGSLGPAIVNSVQDLLAHGGQTGQMPPPGPGGSGPSSGGSPPQQTGPIEFGARPQTPTGFEQQQIAAYDAFMQRNPHATAAQLRAAFPNVSNADQIIAFRDRHGIVAPGASWVMARPNAPAADITGSRGGSPDATNRAIMENTISQGVPLLGPAVSLDQSLRGPEAGNALLHGGQDWSSFGLRDEAGAGINTLAGNGSYDQNIANQRGVDAYDNANHFGDRLAGQITAGLPEAFLPGGMQAQMARGGAQGALYGFGSGEGDFAQRSPNAVLGGLIGAAAPPLLAGAGRLAGATARGAARFVGNAAPLNPERRAIIEAANRQGVDLMRADTGGVGTRMATGVVGRTFGGIPLANAARRSAASAGAAGDRIAADMGTVADPAGAGQAAQRGMRSFLDTSKVRGDQIRSNIPIPPAQPADTAGAVSALSARTTGMTSNPLLSDMFKEPRLQGYLAALQGRAAEVPTGILDAQGNPITRTIREGGGLSWEDLRNFRSRVGEMIDSPPVAGEDNSIVALRHLYAGLSQDMESTAAQVSPRALTMVRRSIQYDRGRAARRQGIVSDILGPDFGQGPEQAFQRINTWAQQKGGNFANVAQSLRSMPPEDANTVRASIFARMGDATAARQDVGAAVAGQQGTQAPLFSPAEFSRQWNLMSDRAKAFLIPDAGHRSALNDLALVTAAQKRASEFQNYSNTSLAANAMGFMAGLQASPIAAVSYALGSYGAGRFLASPPAARWLAQTARVATQSALRSQIRRLGSIAARDPAIAQEVSGLRQALLSGANDNLPRIGSVAASPNQRPDQPDQ